MVQTWNGSGDNGANPPDLVATQLVTIAAKLEPVESLKVEIECRDNTHDPISTQLATKTHPIPSSPNQMGALAAQLAAIATRLDSLLAIKEDIQVIKAWLGVKDSQKEPLDSLPYLVNEENPEDSPSDDEQSEHVLDVQLKIENLDQPNGSKEDCLEKRTYVDSKVQIPNSTRPDSFRALPEFGLHKRQVDSQTTDFLTGCGRSSGFTEYRDIGLHSVLVHPWVYEMGQLTMEWLIAWRNNSLLSDLRTSRFSGPEVLIETRLFNSCF